MNAYELADELNRKLTGKLIGRTAAKLRQQTDRIKELEKELFNKENPVKEVFNAEPVAWMYDFNGNKAFATDAEGAKSFGQNPIPLYTTPQTKPLSDEEIDDMADEILGIQSTEDISYIREFARAIEAKVRGEK